MKKYYLCHVIVVFVVFKIDVGLIFFFIITVIQKKIKNTYINSLISYSINLNKYKLKICFGWDTL